MCTQLCQGALKSIALHGREPYIAMVGSGNPTVYIHSIVARVAGEDEAGARVAVERYTLHHALLASPNLVLWSPVGANTVAVGAASGIFVWKHALAGTKTKGETYCEYT